MENAGTSKWTRRDFLLASGGGLLGAGLLASCGSGDDAKPSERAASTPRRGGTLRAGFVGGSSTDALDGQNVLSAGDAIPGGLVYEGLLNRNPKFHSDPHLAESIEMADGGATWTVRLRPGVTFHNGKTLTADDIVFSFRRILDPAAPKAGAINLQDVDLDNVDILDPRTLRFRLRRANVFFADSLDFVAQTSIVPAGFDLKTRVGTGPFKVKSFRPGEEVVLTRHPDYWREGLPYLDEVVFTMFTDDTAAMNAFLAGQIDVLSGPASPEQVIGDSRFDYLESRTGLSAPIIMAVDVPPFDDVRVRQAFRLLIDRQQIIEQILAGRGEVANDLFGPFDGCYASDLPQREHDPDQARSLLKAAGHDKLTVELTAAPATANMLEVGQVLVQQARDAGVDIKVKQVDVGAYFAGVGTWPFTFDLLPTSTFMQVATGALLPGAFFNFTHWDHPGFNRLYDEALSTVDEAKRCEVVHDMHAILHDEGSYIIPYYAKAGVAFKRSVHGLAADASGPFTNLGGLWLA